MLNLKRMKKWMKKWRKRKTPYSKKALIGAITLFILAAGFKEIEKLDSSQSIDVSVSQPTEAEQNSAYFLIQNFVKTSVSENSKNSLIRWNVGGYRPSDIFTYIRRQTEPEDAWRALCDALRSLDDVDLVMFADEIEKSKSAGELHCKDLNRKIREFWSNSERKLEKRAVLSKIDLKHKNTRINTLAIPVDASAGTVLPQALPLGSHQIAFTFEGGPHSNRTLRIANALAKYKIRANFFEIGQLARDLGPVSREVVHLGHVVGSNAESADPEKRRLDKIDIEHAMDQVKSGAYDVAGVLDKKGADLAQVRVPFFRFPYGASNELLEDLVKKYGGFNGRVPNPTNSPTNPMNRKSESIRDGMAIFYWDIDSLDWKIRDPSKLFDHVVSELEKKKGGIILFHDDLEQTARVIPKLVEWVREHDYQTIVYVPVKKDSMIAHADRL